MSKIKAWFENFKEKQKTRRKRQKRDLDFFEEDLAYLLKLIFIGVEVSEEDLTKKLRLRDKERFELLSDFALVRHYASWSNGKEGGTYSINKIGIEYLLEAEKIRKEEKRSNAITLATIVLAISALVQVVDIWINKPSTKEAIISSLLEAIGGTLILIRDLIPWAIVIFVLWLIFKIYKRIKKK